MKKFIWLIISIINAAAMTLYVYKMPDIEYPVHYGPNLEPDKYGSKWEMLAVSVAVPLILSLFFVIYRYATRKNEKVQQNKKFENIVIPVIIVMFILLMWFLVLSVSGRMSLDIIPTAILTMFGIMMIVMANYMGKTRQNRYFGLRTYATLHNETVWRKAHRLIGKTGTIGGILMLAGAVVCLFLDRNAAGITGFACLTAAVILAVAVPSIYAARLYKELGSDQNTDGGQNTDGDQKTENE